MNADKNRMLICVHLRLVFFLTPPDARGPEAEHTSVSERVMTYPAQLSQG